jgi:nickel/cobalt transporter (NicO) family protein
MYSILISTILISLLHALIPSHWLPLLAISKAKKWNNNQTLIVTFYMGLAHVLSTILLGIIVSIVGYKLNANNEKYFDIIAPLVLITMGVFFIYRHYTHHHFHINKSTENEKSNNKKIIFSLVTLMFFSPCLEVEAFFFSAGEFGFANVCLIAFIYMLISIIGMMLWMNIALHGLKKMDWHKIEHNAGLITGVVLIISGVISYFFH